MGDLNWTKFNSTFSPEEKVFGLDCGLNLFLRRVESLRQYCLCGLGVPGTALGARGRLSTRNFLERDGFKSFRQRQYKRCKSPNRSDLKVFSVFLDILHPIFTLSGWKLSENALALNICTAADLRNATALRDKPAGDLTSLKGNYVSKKISRRVGAALGATAIGVSALIGGASVAFAAPTDFGNIDGDRSGSLTVHKYLHQTNGSIGDPSQAPAAGDFSDPVAGVTFTAYPLLKDGASVDLTVPENWNGLKDLTPGAGCTAPAGYTLGSGIALPATDAAGVASIPLDLGPYQVCETDAPAEIVDRALPFIVTVPLPFQNGWVYDVHTYPKNGKGEIIKTIEEQQDTGLGSIVRFPVTTPIPTMQDQWTGFAISDSLDPRLAVEGNGVASVTVDGVALDSSYYTVTTNGQNVVMKFTDAGVAWLNEGPNAQAGKQIKVVFHGKVVELGNGTIPNTAILWTNNPNLDPNTRPGFPSNEVKTYWGDLAVQKRAAGTSGSEGLLNGAVFQVYNAVDPYAADCSAAVKTGNPIVVNGEDEFTSQGTGVINIAGLFVSDSENPVKNALQRCYVLEEVKAPAGYVLPADPMTPVAVKIGQTTIADNVEILNTQQEVPELPLTGAAGQLILVTGGLAAVILAVVLTVINRRRATDQ